MSVNLETFGIEKLSVTDRLELIELIWDSLPDDVAPEDIPQWHLDIINERRAEAVANPGIGVPWREVLDRLGHKS